MKLKFSFVGSLDKWGRVLMLPKSLINFIKPNTPILLAVFCRVVQAVGWVEVRSKSRGHRLMMDSSNSADQPAPPPGDGYWLEGTTITSLVSNNCIGY